LGRSHDCRRIYSSDTRKSTAAKMSCQRHHSVPLWQVARCAPSRIWGTLLLVESKITAVKKAFFWVDHFMLCFPANDGATDFMGFIGADGSINKIYENLQSVEDRARDAAFSSKDKHTRTERSESRRSTISCSSSTASQNYAPEAILAPNPNRCSPVMEGIGPQ
jgi:hypothetical protein